MSIEITPNNPTSFPGSRLQFTATRNGSQMLLSDLDAVVEVYSPMGKEVATIHETDNTFSWIVPALEGEHDIKILIAWNDTSDFGNITLKINPVLAARFTYQTSFDTDVEGDLHADVYNPMGQLVYSSPMTFNGLNYEITKRPEEDWYEGEYRIALRDDTGVLDVDALWIERPVLAAMKDFFDLPLWHRQLIEYLKYEMMGDTDPLHPGAIFTLEEYARHWKYTVDEINHVPPYTNFHINGVPTFWAHVLLKGTTLRVYHALANRGVTVPRWSGLDVPIQDESHYQQAWETRYSLLRPEYVEERAYMKAHHLPEPTITVDPFLGWYGGNLGGMSGLAVISRPTWFAGAIGYR